MKISLNWLSKYISIKKSPEEISELLTMAGLEVSSLKKGNSFDGVLIGEVKECTKHPNADKLSLCKVDIGADEELPIVCGAPNVRAGMKVPVATVGTVLPEDFKIKKAKIRGEESRGMICSEKELQISDSHEGIMVLPDEWKIGTPFSDLYDTSDTLIELDLTPNRPDALSHIGVARDLSAILNLDLQKPSFKLDESKVDASSEYSVEIEDKVGCPRFAIRIIKNVKIDKSPEWLSKSLRAVGIRSINNIVDASNYVLMELGHPIHTFDMDKLSGNKIIIRSSIKDEQVVTLDGIKHKLPEDTVLVCDEEKPVGIGGIMGLQNSEVSDDTINLLIECAYFDPGKIRKSSKKLGLYTEASKRFERGCDPNDIEFVLDRVCSVILETAGGELSKGIIDIYPSIIDKVKIRLRQKSVNSVIGMEVSETTVKEILNRLEYEIRSEKDDNYELLVPSFRPDVEREIDVIEEVARIVGYDKIPPSEHALIPLSSSPNNNESQNIKLKNMLVGFGFNEIYTNSLMPYKLWKLSGDSDEPVRVTNPISMDMECLRSSLMPRMLEAVSYNFNRQRKSVKLFEDGIVITPDKKSETGVEEIHKVAAIIAGEISSGNWIGENSSADYFFLKGVVEAYLKAIGFSTVTFTESSNNSYHNRYDIIDNGSKLGFMGEISQPVLKEFDLEVGVFYFELEVSLLLKEMKKDIAFLEPSKYPSIMRDLSFIIDDSMQSEKLTAIFEGTNTDLLKSFKISSVYKGSPLKENEKSITYHLIFSSNERTLEESEIDKICEGIINVASDSLNANLRV